MKVYKDIYSFEALEKIKEGKSVYVVDKQEHTVSYANMLSVRTFAEVLHFSDSDRFAWWCEEESDG